MSNQEQYEIRNYSNEMQIEIDDVYACPGRCNGCVLSADERKAYEPDMDEKTLENSVNKLTDYINGLSNIEKVNLTFGIGDHFLMDSKHINHIYEKGASVILNTNKNNGYNGVFITASMIGKHDVIAEKLYSLKETSQRVGVPVYIIAVLDPKNIWHKKLWPLYQENVLLANKLFGRTDLTINISEEAIENITPQFLYDFATDKGFEEVTINWVLTHDNMSKTYFDLNKLSRWLIDFDSLIKQEDRVCTSYRPVIKRVIANGEENTSYKSGLSGFLDTIAQELLGKSIQIDESGNIFPKYEAIGDVAHAPRLKIKAWGNVNDDVSILSLVNNGIPKSNQFVKKQLSNKNCLGCKNLVFCASSGFHIYNHVINGNMNFRKMAQDNIKQFGCMHVGNAMFSHYVASEQID